MDVILPELAVTLRENIASALLKVIAVGGAAPDEINNCPGILYKIEPLNDICMFGNK